VYAPVRVSGLQASIECSVSRRGTISVATSDVLCVGGEERWRLKDFYSAQQPVSRFASSTGGQDRRGKSRRVTHKRNDVGVRRRVMANVTRPNRTCEPNENEEGG